MNGARGRSRLLARSPRTPSLAGRSVLVTGAASGIGAALARLAAAEGARLVLTDVDAVGLAGTVEALPPGAVLAHTAFDVSDHDAVAAFAREVHAEHGPLHVVANVAGVATWGTVSAMSHEEWRRVIEVNLLGPVHVIEEFVPPMVEAAAADPQRGGHLVNVSSAAGVIGMPWHAAYSASKFGLRGVSEVLRFDLERYGIGVSLVCPGAVDTGLTETVRISGVDTSSPRFARARARFRGHAVSPDDAARAILDGVHRGRYWVYTSPDIRLAHLAQRLAPPAYVTAMRVLSSRANAMLPQVEEARR